MKISYLISILETILAKIPIDCPIVVIGDFNVNMLTNTSQLMTLQIMNECGFKNLFFF